MGKRARLYRYVGYGLVWRSEYFKRYLGTAGVGAYWGFLRSDNKGAALRRIYMYTGWG